MNKLGRVFITVFLISLSLVATVNASESGKISGYMFGDYYYVAANHTTDLEDLNGFWFRRIYFAYDQKLDNGLSVRLRTEMSNPGDFSTKEKMIPEVKDAYIKWSSGNTQVFFGLAPTPTWSVVEKIWGYRAVEKTPLDLQKFGSSRDFGLAVKGKLGSSGKVYYHAMFANGNGNASENNKQKKVMGSLGAWLSDNLIVEGYADYDGRPDSKSRNTLQGFMAYKTEQARVGFQLAYQNRKMGEDLADQSWTIWSAFAAAKITGKTSVFARVDGNSDPNPDGDKIGYIPFDPTAKATFIVGGLDFHVSPKLHLMPNVELVSYSAVNSGDSDPATDVIPRVTVFYKF